MEEENVSLCITFPHKYDVAKHAMFRVADLVDNCLIQADYAGNMEELEANCKPRNIGFRPGGTVLNRVEIRKWWFAEQNNKFPASEPQPNAFYEIVYPIEFDECSIDNKEVIRRILVNGFSIIDGASDNLLIVVDRELDYYIALECKKKDFLIHNNIYSVSQNISDISHIPHFFNIRYIHEDDIIGTQNIGALNSDGQRADVRYFYKYLTLEEPNEEFFIRECSDYIPVYINRYIKQKRNQAQFSNNETRLITTIIEEALSKESDMRSFFTEVGYRFENVTEVVNKCKDQIIDVFLHNDSSTKIIEEYIMNSEPIFQKGIEIIRKDWMKEKDAEAKLLEVGLEIAKEREIELSKCIENKESIHEALMLKVGALEKKVKGLEEKRSMIEQRVKVELDNFESQLINYIANETFASRNKEISRTSDSTLDLFISNSILIDDLSELNEINGHRDFISDLSENLQFAGIASEYSYETAKAVCAAFYSGMGIAATGAFAREFANSISALIEGNICEIITLPIGYRNAAELIKQVNKMKSEVVLIENALDSMNESLCISIIKNCKGKSVIFSVEDRANLDISVGNILNYMIVVDVDNMLDFPTKGEYLLGKFDIEAVNIKDLENQRLSYKRLLPLFEDITMKKSTTIILSQMDALINHIESSDDINIILILELGFLHEANGQIDEFIQMCEHVLNDKQNILIKRLFRK